MDRDELTQSGAVIGKRAAASPGRRLGPLSGVARRAKLDFFLPMLPHDARILDLGCADNWFKRSAAERGWTNVVGLDLEPPADIVGDVRDWRSLGLEPHSFDAIVAFEVVEHGDFSEQLYDLLKLDGLLFLTTPVPRMDPVCRLLEALRLLQQRSSPHSHLIDLRQFPRFEIQERRIKAGVSQWGVLRPAFSVIDLRALDGPGAKTGTPRPRRWLSSQQ
jgi:cyclopropane fatty-acyl-phospholipid synthase-like methyltransferase